MLEARRVESVLNHQIPTKLYAEDLEWDRNATHLDDRNSFFPLETLWELANEGIIGQVSPRSYFLPTEYSQQKTSEVDSRVVLDHCIEDGVDALILVPL